MKFQTVEEVSEKILNPVEKAAENLMRALAKKLELSKSDPMETLRKMKFTELGYHPKDGTTSLNLIEQLNQSFTYLATAKALEFLFERHPELIPFNINLGTESGIDIEDKNGKVAAEVFAAVKPKNNKKLNKDIKKVSETDAEHKYVFFISPGFERGRRAEFEKEAFPGVQVWALGDPLKNKES